MQPAPPGAGSCRAAFTLLELLAVLAVLAIIGAIALGVGRRSFEAARVARVRAELATLAAALDAYRRAYGSYPEATPDATVADIRSGQILFAALTGRRGPRRESPDFPIRRRCWIEPTRFTMGQPGAPDTAANYLEDPWGNPYHYAFLGKSSGWKTSMYVLFSAGPDGRATLPLPVSGILDEAFDSALADGRPVNADNFYAHR